MSRYGILREIERLDPERDSQRIMDLSFRVEFTAIDINAYRLSGAKREGSGPGRPLRWVQRVGSYPRGSPSSLTVIVGPGGALN